MSFSLPSGGYLFDRQTTKPNLSRAITYHAATWTNFTLYEISYVGCTRKVVNKVSSNLPDSVQLILEASSRKKNVEFNNQSAWFGPVEVYWYVNLKGPTRLHGLKQMHDALTYSYLYLHLTAAVVYWSYIKKKRKRDNRNGIRKKLLNKDSKIPENRNPAACKTRFQGQSSDDSWIVY